MLTNAIVHTPPEGIALQQLPMPELGEGDVLVEALLTAVSPGTETRLLKTSSPGSPYVPGYCVVGRVTAEHQRSCGLLGRLVLCHGGRVEGKMGRFFGGHQQFHVARKDEVDFVPPGLSARQVALARLASIAFRGASLVKPIPGGRTLVIGLGIIGQLAARIWRARGWNVLGCDRSALRVDFATAAGITAITIDSSLTTALGGLGEFDTIVDCTGVPPVMNEAIDLLRSTAWDLGWTHPPKYVLQGSYAKDVAFDYNKAFAKQAVILIPRDTTSRDRRAVLEMVAAGSLKLEDLLTHTRSPLDAREAYTEVADPNGAVLGMAFDWSRLST
jgi:hypothetical protein